MALNSIHKFLNDFSEISEEAFEDLMKNCFVIDFPKKRHIFKNNTEVPKIYCVLSGIVRTFIIDNKDNEINKTIETKGKVFFSKDLSNSYGINAQALISSEVLEIDVNYLLELCTLHPELIKLYSKINEKIYQDLEVRTVKLLSMTATDRYLNLLDQFPKIENQISQYHIASYIGVTPIQLSRIRRKLNDFEEIS